MLVCRFWCGTCWIDRFERFGALARIHSASCGIYFPSQRCCCLIITTLIAGIEHSAPRLMNALSLVCKRPISILWHPASLKGQVLKHSLRFHELMIARTHSVAAITLGCQRTSLRFLPLPVQPVSRPARPPRGGRMHAPRLPVHPAAARAPHYRRLRARSRSGRPHAPQPPARPAVGRTPRSRTHAPRPPMRPAAPQPAGNARLGGLGGGCLRAGRRRRCPPRLSLHRRRVHAAGHSGLGAGGQREVAEAGPAGGPRPERCLGTENGSVRRP